MTSAAARGAAGNFRGRTRSGLFCALLALATQGCAGLDPALLESVLSGASSLGGGGALDESTVAAGLREALRVGTQRTVDTTSRSGGFLLNELIRIEPPEQLGPMLRGLRTVGFGRQVDELETAMNRAAERAAGEATDVFIAAITRMTIADALGILRGGDTAATDYFRVQTSDALVARFSPIVEQKMQEVGLYRIYRDLQSAYAALPLASKPSIDLRAHVTDRAVAGLFTVLGQEETRIRQDPAARSTELLRKVFASGGRQRS
jgi:hypothetical protein